MKFVFRCVNLFLLLSSVMIGTTLVVADDDGDADGKSSTPSFYDGYELNPYRLDGSPNGAGDPNGSCGWMCDGADQYAFGLYACLQNAFKDFDPVELTNEITVPKVTYSPSLAMDDFSMEDYNTVRGAFMTSRLPAAVLYAENDQDVIDGINCARENGYVVSPRGTGHSYQSLSTLDGALVIDLSLNCKYDDNDGGFKVNYDDQGDHILPGSRYISTMRIPSGCTNAVLLAKTYDTHDKEEGAMCIIGSCPSVGVTGYVLGGGYGDQTPYAGTALDLVDEFEIVLYNGTLVKASQNENSDLFWALRGGGGGFGVITHFTVRTVASPNPTAFTLVHFQGDNNGIELAIRFQDFMYDNPSVSSKYGGSFVYSVGVGVSDGVFLGSIEQAVDAFYDAGLLDEEFYGNTSSFSSASKYNVTICSNNETDSSAPTCDENYGNNKIPEYGLSLIQVNTQGESQAYLTCTGWFIPVTHGSSMGTARSLNVCEDLGVDNSYCTFVPPDFKSNIFEDGQACGNMTEYDEIAACIINSIIYEKCADPFIINATLEAARDPKGFLNHHGPSLAIQQVFETSKLYPKPSAYGYKAPSGISVGTGTGGMVIPKITPETIKKMSEQEESVGFICNHLVHGAPLAVDKDATAYPHRNGGCNTPSNFELVPDRGITAVDALLTDPYFNNDPNKLMGYYNYMGSLRFRNWENFYFADHSDKLSEIRGKYDPTGGFDAPRYVQGKTIQSDVDDPNEPQPVGNGNDDVDEVNDTQANDDCSSILDLVCGSDDFETLCSLVSKFDVLSSSLSSGNWTFFAPNDDAFASFDEDVLDGLSDNRLKKILLFHAVEGEEIYAGDLSCQQSDDSNLIEMANEKDTRVKCKNGIPYGIKGAGNEVPVEFTEVDIKACNGVIHVVDGVLLPPNYLV